MPLRLIFAEYEELVPGNLAFFVHLAIITDANVWFFCTFAVAPLVGAWIEMAYTAPFDSCKSVAPLVGAWIEIVIHDTNCFFNAMSRPSWARGLKFQREKLSPLVCQSRPSWARGLK